MPLVPLALLQGAKNYLSDAAAQVTYDAVADDQEEEIESMIAAADVDNKQDESSGTYLRQQAQPSKKRRLDTDMMSKNLKTASQNIVMGNTLSEYKRCGISSSFRNSTINCLMSRLWEQFKHFCCDIGKVKHPDDVEALFPDLPAGFPEWIAMWIMDKFVWHVCHHGCVPGS